MPDSRDVENKGAVDFIELSPWRYFGPASSDSPSAHLKRQSIFSYDNTELYLEAHEGEASAFMTTLWSEANGIPKKAMAP